MNKIIILSTALLISGCATIVGDARQLVGLNSTPSEAEITIVDEKGKAVYQGKTPTTVTLEKSNGSYWGGKNYKVTIKKEGYDAFNIDLKTSANGWYIGGNLIFGGLIGWFIVDPMSGKMYNLEPKEIDATLAKNMTTSEKDGVKTFKIVLIENVPEKLRKKMQSIN